ncbi:hypothetical protein [Frigoribacterium faeni]|uniref:hypothetical protein n=1 Tax=Frigoribacterium faeni TaxID=145483 RepID=UPI00241357C0|nr:hypothetical protein [Frigoribacterium faeni]
MTKGEPVEDIRVLRQGDVLDVSWLPASDGNTPTQLATPDGVVVLSQTCDIVQNKPTCLVAPILRADAAGISRARKGQSPLVLLLAGTDSTPDQLADLARITSVPKTFLLGKKLLSSLGVGDQDVSARNLAERIGRTFTRFPFPDEVVPAFQKFKKKTQNAVGGEGAFGWILDRVESLRLGADQWPEPARNLTLHFVISSRYLMGLDDADPDWDWTTSRVHGRRRSEQRSTLTLDRVTQLLQANIAALEDAPDTVDMTTILYLWEEWVTRIGADLFRLEGDAIATLTVNLISDLEFTYADWKRSESLDLDVLSDSRNPEPTGQVPPEVEPDAARKHPPSDSEIATSI